VARCSRGSAFRTDIEDVQIIEVEELLAGSKLLASKEDDASLCTVESQSVPAAQSPSSNIVPKLFISHTLPAQSESCYNPRRSWTSASWRE